LVVAVVPDVLLHAGKVNKSFGGIRALCDVDLDIEQGEVHGLIGPNGSGKSTLMKIFAGYYRADDGEVTINGEPLGGGIVASRRQGITIVPQEITLVPSLTVEDNIVLGSEPAVYGIRSRTMARRAAEKVLAEVGCDVAPTVLAHNVVPSQRRLVMVAAALHRGAEILILDEPTAGLATEEAQHVTDAIERLKSAGRTVLLVSHRLDELIALSDRITVIREGQVVARFLERKAERPELIRLIAPTQEVVSATASHQAADPHPATPSSATDETVLLQLEDGAVGALRRLSFSVRRGECVGIVGGVGSGVREVAEVLSGALKLKRGRVRTSSSARIASTSDALRAGVLFISGERHRFVIHDRSVGFHICLPSLESRSRLGFVSKSRETAAAAEALASVGVTASPGQSLASLSGGNQQRALFARAALGNPDVIAVYEPSVGVDVHGRELLREHLRQLQSRHGVVLLSSDPEELAGLCARVICLRNGEPSVVLAAEEITVGAMLDGIS
jgi:ribose transport system ATP-binding protein